MRIVVIGSNGFVGSACARILGQQHEITGADIAQSDRSNYFHIRDSNSFDELFAKTQFDCCINASGSANVGFSFQNPDKDYELNVSNVRLMLEAIEEHQSNCKFINFSSAAVYGNPDSLPIGESARLSPLSPYGKHKLLSEQLLKEFAEQVPSVSLRVFSAYGPKLHKQLFWDIYQKFLKSESVVLFGTGTESRDFIYIDDLVAAINCVIEKGTFDGDAINVSSGVESTILEAAETFLQAAGKSFRLSFSGEVKEGDPVNWRASIDKLSALGFQPRITLQEGLALTMNDYRKV